MKTAGMTPDTTSDRRSTCGAAGPSAAPAQAFPAAKDNLPSATHLESPAVQQLALHKEDAVNCLFRGHLVGGVGVEEQGAGPVLHRLRLAGRRRQQQSRAAAPRHARPALKSVTRADVARQDFGCVFWEECCGQRAMAALHCSPPPRPACVESQSQASRDARILSKQQTLITKAAALRRRPTPRLACS